MRAKLWLVISVILVSSTVTPPALAEMEAKAVLVAARAIGFARPPAPDGAKIAVVGSAAALADVKAALPKFTVVAADGVGDFAAFVSNSAEAKAAGAKVLTIGPVACVEAGACVMGIETNPKVTIYLSNAAAAAAGIDFDPNFRLMVTTK